jgi:hypothetical protein
MTITVLKKDRKEHLRKRDSTPTKLGQKPTRPKGLLGQLWRKQHQQQRMFFMGGTVPWWRAKTNILPVDLDRRTLGRMKKIFERVLGVRESMKGLELANAWVGSNDLLDAYATASRPADHAVGSVDNDKRYAFMLALNRLECQWNASRRTISNWDEALAFIESEMNLPADDDDESRSDAFIQRMKAIEIDRDVLAARRSSLLFREMVNRIAHPVDEDDAMLLEDLRATEQAEAERKNAIMEVKEEKAGYTITPISDADCQHIRDAMQGGYEDDIVAKIDEDTVQRRSLATLLPGQWLNDEVIHAYLQLLSCDKQHFFKSFFVTKLLNENVPGQHGQYQYANVKRWSKKVKGKDIFALDKVFFPVNQNNVHWTLAVAFVQERRLQFYDSMGGSGRQYLVELERYFHDEHKDKKKSADPRVWTLEPCTTDTPRQRNVVDCGVFVCMFAEFLSRDRPLTFSQDDIYNCRDRIAHSLLTKTTAE